MMAYILPVVIVAAIILLVSLVWRAVSRHRSLPCPPWLAWMLENPISKSRTPAFLSCLELSSGLRVLDAGCGPGRLTIPIAQAVGPNGAVLAVDIQPEMLHRAQANATEAALSNVEFLLAGLGEGKLPGVSL
jgi:2-polyprenyl-3-methyl-5-hydroxy-6-metoxy-1,4-benzoquinol methylase